VSNSRFEARYFENICSFIYIIPLKCLTDSDSLDRFLSWQEPRSVRLLKEGDTNLC